MTYEISYIGMDGISHTETHVGDEASKNRVVTFIEERGTHCISVEDFPEE